jgi:hypothetical protein
MKVQLTEQWQPFVVRWEKLQQGGWGGEARFDPARLLNLNFSVNGKDLPVEFWLDDIRFFAAGDDLPQTLNPTPPATPASGEAPTSPNAKATPAPSSKQ